MPITLRCPLCNAPAQIYRTNVITKQTATGVKGENVANLTTEYYVRCSDPTCLDKMQEPPRWKVVLEFSGWAYDPQTPIFEEIKPVYLTRPSK